MAESAVDDKAVEVMATAISMAIGVRQSLAVKAAQHAYAAYQAHVQATMESVVMDNEGEVIERGRNRDG